MKKTILILFLTSALLVFTQPTHAGTFLISPAGGPLDADPILDVETSPGSTLIFDIYLNSTGNMADVNNISYDIYWDPNELELVVHNAYPPGGLNPTSGGLLFLGPSEVRVHTNNVNPTITPNQSVLIGRWDFLVLDGLNNDGMKDLGLTDASEENVLGSQFISTFDANGLEVQPGDPVIPEPATMLLFGSGMVGAFLRRRIQA